MTKTTSPDPNSIIESLTAELRQLAKEHRDRAWRMGEIVAELVKRGRSQESIAADIGEAESNVSEWKSCYLAFPTEDSRMGATYTDCHQARKFAGHVSKGQRAKYGTPAKFLRKLQSERAKGKATDARSLHSELA